MAAAVGYYPRFKSTIPATGLPNVGGTVAFFAAGTSTPLPVFSDATLTVPLANPLTLDANGEALFYTGAGVAYKVTVRDPVGTLIWTEDNVIFGGGSGSSVVGGTGSEWIQFAGTPVFINATQFSVVGDQRATFDVKRRTKSTVTAGFAYGTVVANSFGGGNTLVTLLNDTGSALDAGLSVVQYSILDPMNSSIPLLPVFFRKNFLVNGAMLVAQRLGGPAAPVQPGAGVAAYTLDRWQGKSVNGNATYQQSGTVGLIDGFPNAIRIQRVAANAQVTSIQLAQSLESNDSSPMSGQSVTLSFWARAGGNYSPAGGLLNAAIIWGTGADQNVLAGYTGAANVASANAALVNAWTRFQFGGPVASLTPNEVGIVFTMTPVGVAGASDYCEITGVQLEIGTYATDFDHRPAGEVLARCQRYYQKSFPYNTVPNQGTTIFAGALAAIAGKAGVTGNFLFSYYPAPLRISVVPTTYNPQAANNQVRDNSAGDCSGVNSVSSSANQIYVVCQGNAATAVGNQLYVHWTADAEL